MKAIISESALAVMLASAVEVYPKEVYGVIGGRRFNGNFYADLALPYQETIRKRRTVVYIVGGENGCDNVLESMACTRIIGDYHSHTQIENIRTDLRPSDADFSEIRDKGFIFIVGLIEKEGIIVPPSLEGRIAGRVEQWVWYINGFIKTGKNRRGYEKLNLERGLR